MEFDFRKLSGRIVERYGTRSAFAADNGYTESAVSNRLNNKIPFGADEIYRLCLPEKLDIQPEDIPAYFFTPKVL